jgi:deoxyribodipyrimidine photo-lyase
MTTAIWWIRRDLRLTDNQALAAALEQADRIVPTFILHPNLRNSDYVGPKRLAFLWGGLRRLEADLQAAGSRLILRRGEPREELGKLLSESGASTIFAEEDVSPYARRRDSGVAESLPLQLLGGLTVHPPEAVLKADGTPYTVYTPFSKAWKALPRPSSHQILPAPASIPTPNSDLPSHPIPTEPTLPSGVPFIPGEAEAQRRLAAFTEGSEPPLFRYAGERNRMDLAGTSGLSPYFRFGMLSARRAAVAARRAIEQAPTADARKGAETWLNELIWREFYLAILYHFPQVRGASFRPEYDQIAWANDQAAFAAWQEGRTGYPVVDAAMRQLRESGWMHNRARMIVASFLVKDLLIDWRWGERWFMQHLVDGDPAANNGGWQWTAGTGTDAAPYFRIFNPVLQSEKYDPDGEYIRRWVPELAGVSNKFIHAPWEMPAEVQKQAGCLIGRDYPEPIIDHKQARERTLEAYGQVK